MTEEEWLACDDPDLLLDLPHCKNLRQRRLFACECARSVLQFISREPFEEAVLACEAFADDAFPRDQLKALHLAVSEAKHRYPPESESEQAAWAVYWACDFRMPWLSRLMPRARLAYRAVKLESVERTRQTALVREVFSNPFRPVTFDSTWQTETVVALATGIYAERAFDRMPILADALEDAGCDNADILNHCRGEGPHVRGCWVVDLLLGKN